MMGRSALEKSATAIIAMFLTGFTTAQAAPPDVSTEPVVSFLDPIPEDPEILGTSTVRRTDKLITVQLQTTGLTPGNAYTSWILVFNDPCGCVHGPGTCGADPADFLPAGPARFGFTHLDGKIVGGNGAATFAGNLEEGETLHDIDFPDGLGAPLEDARKAEILLIVRNHGPKDPGRVREQTHTLEIELGLEADQQFSVHPGLCTCE